MCVVLQHILARETLRSPVASLWPLVLWGIEPLRTNKTYCRFITRTVWPLHHHSGERSCYPRHPHDRKGDFRSPFGNPSTNDSAVGSRPAFRLLDFDQGQRPWMRFMTKGRAPHAVKPSPQPSALSHRLHLCRPGDPPRLDLASPRFLWLSQGCIGNPFSKPKEAFTPNPHILYATY